MTIYIYGCNTCGINGVYANKIKKYADINGRELEIKNSKYDKIAREEHANHLSIAGFDKDTYQPIVVDGSKVVRLREWS